MSCSLEIQLIMFFKGKGFVKVWKFQTMLLPISSNLPRICFYLSEKGRFGGGRWVQHCARVSLWLIEEHGYFQRIFNKNYPIKTRYIYLICIYVFIRFEITNFYKWEGPLLNTTPDTPPGNPMAYTFFPKRRQRHDTPTPQKVRPLVMRWE